MSIINEQICVTKWMEEYASTPLINPITKEEIIARLTKLGVLLSNGEIAPEYKNLIVEK